LPGSVINRSQGSNVKMALFGYVASQNFCRSHNAWIAAFSVLVRSVAGTAQLGISPFLIEDFAALISF
jgi:hypothetical protein